MTCLALHRRDVWQQLSAPLQMQTLQACIELRVGALCVYFHAGNFFRMLRRATFDRAHNLNQVETAPRQ